MNPRWIWTTADRWCGHVGGGIPLPLFDHSRQRLHDRDAQRCGFWRVSKHPQGAPHKECEGSSKVAIKVDGLKQPVWAIASGGSFNAAILKDCSLLTWGKLFLFIKVFLLMDCWIGTLRFRVLVCQHCCIWCVSYSTYRFVPCHSQGAHDSSFAKKLLML
jgi:hypothetical protein